MGATSIRASHEHLPAASTTAPLSRRSDLRFRRVPKKLWRYPLRIVEVLPRGAQTPRSEQVANKLKGSPDSSGGRFAPGARAQDTPLDEPLLLGDTQQSSEAHALEILESCCALKEDGHHDAEALHALLNHESAIREGLDSEAHLRSPQRIETLRRARQAFGIPLTKAASLFETLRTEAARRPSLAPGELPEPEDWLSNPSWAAALREQNGSPDDANTETAVRQVVDAALIDAPDGEGESWRDARKAAALECMINLAETSPLSSRAPDFAKAGVSRILLEDPPRTLPSKRHPVGCRCSDCLQPGARLLRKLQDTFHEPIQPEMSE